MAASMSMGMSCCIWRSKSKSSQSSVGHYGVLILFSLLKDLSAEQLVTGRVQSILIRTEMLGYMELVCFKVSVRLVGNLYSLNDPEVVVATLCASYVAHFPSIQVMEDPFHTGHQEV